MDPLDLVDVVAVQTHLRREVEAKAIGQAVIGPGADLKTVEVVDHAVLQGGPIVGVLPIAAAGQALECQALVKAKVAEADER